MASAGYATDLAYCAYNFFGITVLADITPAMRIWCEETFGPVAGISAFDTEEEALKMANDTDVGLAGYFFTQDMKRCRRVAERPDVGMLGMNVGAISDPVAPFGGVKQSGVGREGGRVGMEEYLVTKMIMTAVE